MLKSQLNHNLPVNFPLQRPQAGNWSESLPVHRRKDSIPRRICWLAEICFSTPKGQFTEPGELIRQHYTTLWRGQISFRTPQLNANSVQPSTSCFLLPMLTTDKFTLRAVVGEATLNNRGRVFKEWRKERAFSFNPNATWGPGDLRFKRLRRSPTTVWSAGATNRVRAHYSACIQHFSS